MEGDSTNSDLVREMAVQCDEANQSVMPRYWEGHARLAIAETDAVPASAEQSVLEKANEIAVREDVTPQTAAKALIRKLKEKQG